jgi:hypothetical protein
MHRGEPSVPYLALEQQLRQVEPGFRFVSYRLMTVLRSILSDRGVRLVPHAELPLWIKTDFARSFDILPETVTAGAEAELLLIVDPADRLPHKADAARAEAYAQRLLMYGRIQRATFVGAWDALPEQVRTDVEFYLRSEELVPADANPAELYTAFAAEYLTAKAFDPDALPYLFPGVSEPEFRDIGVSLPAGYTPPQARSIGHSAPEKPVSTLKLASTASIDHAKAVRNHARAAILLARSGDATQSLQLLQQTLLPRLAEVLQWDAATAAKWTEALPPLLLLAAHDHWNAASKTLYDMQKVVVEHAEELSAVDPIGWLKSFGKKPLLRKLTLARQSILLQQLKKTRKHLHDAGLTHAQDEKLSGLLEADIHSVETKLRETLRPLIHEAFVGGGLNPQQAYKPGDTTGFPIPLTVEVQAREAMIEELLDTLCEKGHTRMSHLRDAVARNDLKMSDLASPVELARGDALLQTDRLLAEKLDGLHHRGEIYLRAIQRVSSIGFGTTLGRLFTKFVLLPFGAAVMVVEFGKYIAHEITDVSEWVADLFKSGAPVEEASATLTPDASTRVAEFAAAHANDPHPGHHHAKELFTTGSVTAMLVLGVLFLLLMHVAPVRRLAQRGLRHLGRGLKYLFVTLPVKLWNLPLLRKIRSHRFTIAAVTRGGWPLVAGLLVGVWFLVVHSSFSKAFLWGGSIFALLLLMLNLPLGRRWQYFLDERLSDLWRGFCRDFLPGVVSFFVWLFRELLGFLDRLLYTVDEWFRFRPGQSEPSLILKVVLGVIWFPIAYVIRFAFYLLIEPQVNPVKHFPVVTVSHKLLLPMIPSLVKSTGLSLQFVTTVIFAIPGIFGFMVWELMENWRMYRASRPRFLKPRSIGHHGETVRGLLRPGFHSGTVPAVFRKMRKTLNNTWLKGTPAVLGKKFDELHHIEHALHTFLERHVLALLHQSKPWAGLTIEMGEAHLTLQSMELELRVPELSEESSVLGFRRIDDAIVVHATPTGFVPKLTPEQLEVWETAMRGVKALGASGTLEDHEAWVKFWQQQTT